MPQAWFICPYDHTTTPTGQPGRAPGMKRYIPATPGPEGERWDEAECLGNHCIVKVDAPLPVLEDIRDEIPTNGFMEVPTSQGTIPALLRPALQVYLIARGYTLEEVLGVSWSSTGILNLLTIGASILAVGNGGQITPLNGRRPAPKTVAQIEQLLPTPITVPTPP